VVIAGAVAGVIAGVLGAQLQGVAHDSLTPRTQAGVFVGSIAALLGGMLNSWQAFGARSYRSAILRLAIGLVVGAASGACAVVAGNAIVHALVDDGATDAPGVVTLVWMVVAVLVGLAVGALRSWRGTISGVLGGAVGGLVGGGFFAQTSGEFSHHALLLDGSEAPTYLSAGVAAAAVGCAIGLVSRSLRRATLTVIEGRSRGMELVVDRQLASIGAGTRNVLVLAGDPNVARQHAVIDLRTNPAQLDALAEVIVDGQAVVGRHPIRNGAVLQIGGSFLRFEPRS
jgi:hypothetical protein